MSERLDLNKKESWTLSRAKEIAHSFGYYCTPHFKKVLIMFIEGDVVGASITNYLAVVAEGFFRSVEPPLKKKKTFHKQLLS